MPDLLTARYLRQLGNEDWISPVIDRSAASKEPERWVRPILDIHPSASATCARSVELWMLGYRTAVKSQSRHRMDNGNKTHDRWNDYFEEAGLLHASNVRLVQREPFPWSGECDVILKNPATGTLHVGELKSMNSHRFRNIPDQLENRTEMAYRLAQVEKHYVEQLTQYLVKIPSVYNVSTVGFFLFENTDNQDYKVLFVEPDERMRSEAFRVPREAQDAAMAGFLLPAPYKKRSPVCSKCWRAAMCYTLQDGDEEAWSQVNEALKLTSGPLEELYGKPTTGFEDLELLDSDDLLA